MKKLISISLALILAGGVLLTDAQKAEAMHNAAAALLTASFVLLSIPIVSAIAHDHYGHPAYAGSYGVAPYPGRTRVVYVAPQYKRHNRHDWRRGHAYESGRPEHRGRHEYRRDHDNPRGRYADRYGRGHDD